MYINSRNLCIGCMRPLDSAETCPHCGLKQDEYAPIPRCLTPGTVLAGRYMTGRVLGEGSFGITYIGWDLSMNIPVAVKEYFPSDMVSRDVICGSGNEVYLYENEKKKDYDAYLKKFFNEAKCLSRFNQVEGIVSVRDFFYENNTAYIVMQYIEGISVKQYIEKNGKIPAKKVIRMIHPVLMALEQVHGTGIIHRDISPDNIMIKPDQSLVLIDFGAARMRNMDTTRTMTVMFKRGYSPEEQYRYKGKWGPYTDVYSICATIYFMMTGKTPVDSVIRALKDDMPSLVGVKDIGIPVSQRKAVMKGLAVTLKNRWQSIEELCQALYGDKGEAEAGRGIVWWCRNRKKVLTMVFVMALSGSLTMAAAWGAYGSGDGQMPEETALTSAPTVMQQVPDMAGTAETIALAASEGAAAPREYKMVSLKGLTKAKAEKKLKGFGGDLKIKWKEDYSTKVAKGKIISQSIPKGTVFMEGSGTSLKLVVSKGEKKVSMPLCTGKSYGSAQKLLSGKKLKYKLIWEESGSEKGIVIRQSVDEGKKIRTGTTVTLTVSKGRTPARTPVPTQKPTQKPKKQGDQGDDFAGVIQ